MPIESESKLQLVEVRRELRRVLVSDTDFDAFCTDCFPSVQRSYFAEGMQPLQKETLLLQCANPEEILSALNRWQDTLVAIGNKQVPTPRGKHRLRTLLIGGSVLGMVAITGFWGAYLTYRPLRATQDIPVHAADVRPPSPDASIPRDAGSEAPPFTTATPVQSGPPAGLAKELPRKGLVKTPRTHKERKNEQVPIVDIR